MIAEGGNVVDFPPGGPRGGWRVGRAGVGGGGGGGGTGGCGDGDPAGGSGKRELAFRAAWLAIGRCGNSTFVQVVDISAAEYEQAVRTLALHLAEVYGAPSQEDAARAARREVDDMAALCDHPPGSLLSIERDMADRDITEKISVLAPPDEPALAKSWTLVEDD